MKKVSFKELAEIIGISAIVASLVFVGLEQRQANRFARLAALESIASEWISANLALAGSDVLSDLLLRVSAGATSSDFTEIERERLNNILSGLDHHWEMRFDQINLGVLERGDYSFPRLGNTLYDSAYHRELWPSHRHGYSDDFAEFRGQRYNLAPEQ